MARTSNYALRLLTSLKAEAEKVAAEEGTTLNQFINVAVAEKLAALRTAQYFQERAARADLAAFDLFQQLKFLIRPVGRQQAGDRLPNHFRCGVTKHAFRPCIPAQDHAAEIFADDSIVGIIYDRCQE